MKRLALLKGMLAALLIMFIMLAISSNIPEPTAHKEHLPVMNYLKPIPLSNDNVVDVLSEYMDTRNLHTVNVRQGVLHIELLLNNDEPYREQVYNVIPNYISLAFQLSNNVKQLKVNVLQAGRKSGEELQLLQLHIYADDAWLQGGLQEFRHTPWLEQADWIRQLRIEKSIFWLPQYEV